MKTDKDNEIIELLKSQINSRIQLTTHREIAAWTITAFYFGILAGVNSFLNDHFSKPNLIFAVFFVLICCFIVAVFIHSQYGNHVRNRTIYNICVKKLFQIINGDLKLNKENRKVTEKAIYPKFIHDEVEKRTTEAHHFSNIGPHVIFIWLFIRMKILCLNKKYDKIQLIESSLYAMVLLPTIYFVFILSVQGF